ncbi:hypothetical protein EYF80_007621 [Liparis tanakae]|uniref:Uncharacterized protein n=1 Tax=Liparis tanakae TaxID=230148 RepID=A0A4Z2IVI8_9TELE|nr:hypothetical protein EYF80_007621 [Liparis tanakae]
MCLDETFLSLCGPVASEHCEPVLSSGSSCLVVDPEVCCDSDPRVKRDTGKVHAQVNVLGPHIVGRFGVEHRVDAAVQVGLVGGLGAASHGHDGGPGPVPRQHSHLPVLVSTMMALAQHLKEASTAPMAVVSVGSRVRWVVRRSSSNICLWYMAASASRAI